MRKILIGLVALFYFVAGGIAQENSLLWKVYNEKTEAPSYLYGTIHVQAREVFQFDNIVYEKMSSCDALAVELLMDEIDPAEIREQMLMEDGKLSDYLTDEQYSFLDSVMKSATGQPLMLFDKMKPFFLMSQLMQSYMPSDMPMALDMHFIDTARKMEMEMIALEDLSDQIGAIDKMSIEDQIEMLVENYSDADDFMDQGFDKLVDAYLAQNLDSLFVLTQDTALPKEFGEELIVKRNKAMAKEISKIIKKTSVFAAFGAAHLPGEKGVINLLRKKGYTVEPVSFDFNN